MVVFEGGGDLNAEAGLALGDDGEAEADNEDAEFEEAIAFGDSFGFVADHDGDDRGRGIVQVKAEVGQAGTDFFDVGVEPGDALWLALDDFDGFFSAEGDGSG